MVDEVEFSTTLSTAIIHRSPTSTAPWQDEGFNGQQRTNIIINIRNTNGSTGKGILIGMLSAFGSAAFVVIIFAISYFFRHTSRGRVFLDRIARPGEFDDEETWAREEAEALDIMDDLQRVEYLRAKGLYISPFTLNR